MREIDLRKTNPKRRTLEVARLRFEHGYSPGKIAEKTGLNRSSVSRILKRAEELNLVEHRIRVPEGRDRNGALERKLKSQYGLIDAVVINVPESLAQSGRDTIDWFLDDELQEELGRAAADFFKSIVHNGAVIGVGMGRTVQSTILALRRSKEILADRVTVFSLASGTAVSGQVGDDGVDAIVSANSNAVLLGRSALRAEVVQLSGPAYKQKNDPRSFVWTIDDRGRMKPDFAILGVGTVARGFPHCFEVLRHELDPESAQLARDLENKVGLIRGTIEHDEESRGTPYFPVGDLLSEVFPCQPPRGIGHMKTHPSGRTVNELIREISATAKVISDRVVAARPEEHLREPNCIVVSGGTRKTYPIHVTLSELLRADGKEEQHYLVTDDWTARALLELSPHAPVKSMNATGTPHAPD